MKIGIVVWFVICTIIRGMCQTHRNNLGRLNMKLSRLFGKTDALQKEIDNIWDTFIAPDKGCNKTRTDALVINGPDVESTMNETDGYVQNLAAIEGVKQYVDAKLQTIHDELNETKGETENELARLNASLYDLSVKQTELEIENKALQETSHVVLKEIATLRNALSSTIPAATTTPTKSSTPTAQMTTTTMPTTATTLPEDWKSFNGHDYLVVLVYKSWDDASTFCASRNSYLAEVVADAEAEFLVNLLYEYKETNSLWFRATDRDKKGFFVYQHCKQPVPEKYWRDSQPNDYFKEEHCVMMRLFEGFEYMDGRCEWERYFVCERENASLES